MKFLILLSVLALSIYNCVAFSEEVCAWQQARNEVVDKFSQEGQETLLQVAKTLQFVTGAAAVPGWKAIGEKYSSELESILSSSDADNLKELGNLVGYDNILSGAGDLDDACAVSSQIESLVSQFSPKNQAVVEAMLSDFFEGYKVAYPSLVSVSLALNAEAVDNLKSTESEDNLKELAALYGF